MNRPDWLCLHGKCVQIGHEYGQYQWFVCFMILHQIDGHIKGLAEPTYKFYWYLALQMVLVLSAAKYLLLIISLGPFFYNKGYWDFCLTCLCSGYWPPQQLETLKTGLLLHWSCGLKNICICIWFLSALLILRTVTHILILTHYCCYLQLIIMWCLNLQLSSTKLLVWVWFHIFLLLRILRIYCVCLQLSKKTPNLFLFEVIFNLGQ